MTRKKGLQVNEDYSWRENIRIYNIPENEYEDCIKIATTLYEEVGGENTVQLHGWIVIPRALVLQ